MRGSTEALCRERLRRHLSNSAFHQNVQAQGPEAIERIVSDTEVKLWGAFIAEHRERSRSRDSPPPSPSQNSPSQAPAPPPMIADFDEFVLLPAAELMELAAALEIAAYRIRRLVDTAPTSFDV